MRVLLIAALLTAPLSFNAVFAQTPAPAAAAHYTTASTTIGTLLDDPSARAVVDKHIPGFSSQAQIDLARSMTMKAIQQYAPDKYTDQVLGEIDADLAKLPAKP